MFDERDSKHCDYLRYSVWNIALYPQAEQDTFDIKTSKRSYQADFFVYSLDYALGTAWDNTVSR